MSVELWALLAATLLGLVHLLAPVVAFSKQVDVKYTLGPRDQQVEPAGVAARLFRAQSNFMETYPFFAVCVLIVSLTGNIGVLSHIGALLYLGARIVYLPLYASGVPALRTLVWGLAVLGLVLVGVQALL